MSLETSKDILLTAIAIERYGQEFYARFGEAVPDRKGKALMKGLGGDEREHEELLTEHYKSLFKRAPPKKIGVDIGARAVKEIFALKKEKERKDPTIGILQIGILVEKKSVDFYTDNAAKVTDDKLKGLLVALIDIEKGHMALLEENLFHMRQEGSWWGYAPILEG
jgi:rubrerythrin